MHGTICAATDGAKEQARVAYLAGRSMTLQAKTLSLRGSSLGCDCSLSLPV